MSTFAYMVDHKVLTETKLLDYSFIKKLLLAPPFPECKSFIINFNWTADTMIYIFEQNRSFFLFRIKYHLEN